MSQERAFDGDKNIYKIEEIKKKQILKCPIWIGMSYM